MTTKLHALVYPLFLPLILLALLSGAMTFLALEGKETIGLLAILAVLGAAIIFVRPELGILLFLASFFITYGRFIPTEGRFTPNNLLGLLFAVLLLVKIYQEKSLSFMKETAIQVFLVIVLFSHFSSNILERELGNPFPELDLTGVMLHELTSRFIFLIFFVNFIRTLRHVKMVLWLILAIILVSAINGSVNSLQGTDFDMGGRAASDLGISAAANANRLAFFCVLGVALSWYCRQLVESRLIRLVLTIAVPSLALATLLTASRSGFLNLLLVFGLFAMEGRFSVKRQLRLILPVAVVIFLASEFLSGTHLERLGNIIPGSSIEVKGATSTENRLDTIRNVWKIVLQNPILGTGIGNVRWVLLEMSGDPTPPHNSYLLTASEGGVFMLGLYLLLFGLTLKHFLNAEKQALRPDVRLIARSLRVCLIAFLFFTMFADFWSSIVTYFFVGMAIVLRRLQTEELPHSSLLKPTYQPVPASI